MPHSQSDRPMDILLVEDSAGDTRLTIEVFAEIGSDARIHAVHDGVEALDYLRRLGSYADAPRPDLIILDLNMPRMDGRELLKEIKRNPDLQQIPAIVLSTSSARTDISEAYTLNANCYFTKPVNLPEFMELARAIEAHWLRLALLPSPVLPARQSLAFHAIPGTTNG